MFLKILLSIYYCLERVSNLNGKVTEIEAQKKNSERVNVYVNNQFSFACSLELVYKYGLQKNKNIDEVEIKGIAEEDNIIKGKNLALKFIEKSYKTEKQLRDKLLEKGYEEESIIRIISFMKEYGFIDDVRYTAAYIKDKIRQQGSKRVKFSLVRKGIAEELIKDKLSQVPEELEENNALILAEKKLKVLMKSEKDVKKIYKKIGDYLIRSGYDYSTVKQVTNNLLKDIEIDAPKSENEEKDMEELSKLAEKRYNYLLKTEADAYKLYKKLFDYLVRKGYSFEEVKRIVNQFKRNEGE